MPPRLFISYARVDVAYAEALERALSSRALATWRDKRDIETDWSRDIAQALAASSACCVIWTDAAAGSQWVRHEWLTARALGKPLHIVAPDGVAALPRPLQNAELIVGDDAGRWAEAIVLRTAAGRAAPIDYTIVPEGSWLPFLPDPRFAGRWQELVDLYLAVVGGLNAMGRAVLGLIGLGGTGKTALAVEFSYRFSFGFDRILWLQGADPTTWRQQLARLARDLVGIDADAANDGAAVRRLGAALSAARCLLVVDNVDDPRTLNREGVLGFDVPVTMLTVGASVLYTSRVGVDLPAAKTYELPSLDPDAATQLLTADRQPVGTDEAAAVAQIRNLTGSLALALSLANTFLREHADIGYRKFAAALRSRMFATLDSLGVSEESLATRHDVALSATLDWHVESLREPHSKDMLTALALYPEATLVPDQRLEIVMHLAADTEALVSPFAKALRELKRVRLAEPVGRAMVRVHPIVRSFVIDRTPEAERRQLRERSAANVRTHYESADRLVAQYERRGLADILDDVVYAADWASETGDARSWLMALRKVIERETLNLSHPTRQGGPAQFLQQMAWRYRDIGHPQAEVLEGALRDRGEAHVAAQCITPSSDPGLLREAASSNAERHEVDYLAIHERSGTLVSWTWDRGALWDLEKLQPRVLLEGGDTYLYAMAITPAGDTALTVDSHRVLRELDLASGKIRRQLRLELPRRSAKGFNARACAIAPGARRIVLAFDDRETFPKSDDFFEQGHSMMAVWDIDVDGRLSAPRVLPLRARWLNRLGMDVEGAWLLAPGPNNGTVDVLDARSGALVVSLTGPESGWAVQAPDDFAASSALGIVAVQLADNVAVWDVPEGTLRHVQTGISSGKLALDLPTRTLLIATPQGVVRCDAMTGRAMRHYYAVDPNCLALDATRRILVTGGPEGLVTTWDLRSPEGAEGFRHESPVRRMVLRGNGSLWLSLSFTELAFWTAPATARVLLRTEGRQAHVDAGGRLVETSNLAREVREISAFDVHEASGHLLMVGSNGAWSLQRLDESGVVESLDGAAGKIPYEECGFVDGGRLAVLVRADGCLEIIDVVKRTRRTMSSRTRSIAGAAFARDVPVVVLGSAEGHVEVIDIATGQELWTFEHGVNEASRRTFSYWNRSGEGVNVVRVSPDGRFLVLGFVDDRPMFVNLAQGRRDVASGHQHIVWAAAIDAEAGLIATGDEERRVIVWDLATGAKLTELFIDAGVTALEFRNGRLAIGDRCGRTYVGEVRRGRGP